MTTKLPPKIKISYPNKQSSERSLKEIQLLLDKLLPHCNRKPSQKEGLDELFPALHWEYLSEGCLSISFACKHRIGVVHFFYDMITRWLLPSRRLNSSFFFSSDFYLPEITSSLLTAAQIVVPIETKKDRLLVEKNRASLESEILLGAHSLYHANRILEFKGLSTDKKTEMIQRKIGSLIQHKSDNYDRSIFSQMQRFLVTSKEEFKNLRSYHHMSRMISLLHVVRKNLQNQVDKEPLSRQVLVKFMKARLLGEKKKNPVLGVLVGMNFLQEYEAFQEKHLIKAIRSVHLSAAFVPGSCIIDRSQNSNLQTIYLEIQKESIEEFSVEEIQKMRSSLPGLIERQIEYLTHPIFMPRNEEEVLRNIMALSKQLKYVGDIPQVVVTFDEQSGPYIRFTVIFLRVIKEDALEMKRLLSKLPRIWSYQIERRKKVGTLRRKYPKEAHVFSVSIPSENYLQDNHFVDLYKARKDLMDQLEKIFGDVRDYNGGMIHKQTELVKELKSCLGKEHLSSHFFLEKLFFSIQPSEMRNLLTCPLLKQIFFQVELAKKKKHKAPFWTVKEGKKEAVFVALSKKSSDKKKVFQLLQKEEYPSCELLFFHIDECFGVILLSNDSTKKNQVTEIFRKTIS